MYFFGRDPVVSVLLLLASTMTAGEQRPAGKPTEAGRDALQETRRRSATLQSEGKVEEGIHTLAEGIQMARHQGEAPGEIARALNDLGTFYQDMYRLPEALRCYEEAIALMTKCCTSSPGIVVVLNNIGRLRLIETRYAEAEKTYREAERLASRPDGSDTSGLTQSWLGLAEVYLSTNRHSEAQALAEKTLRQLTNSDYEASGTALFLLSRVASSRRKYEQAEHSLRQALQSWRASIGSTHPSYAAGLASLAMLLSRKRPAEAERLFMEALEIVEANLGRNHYYYAQMALQYSAHLQSHGRKKEGRALMEWAKAIAAEQGLRNRTGFTVDVQALRERE